MKSNRSLAIALTLVVLAALWLLRGTLGRPGVNLRPSAAVGEILAAEVERLLGSGGGQVALVSRQPPADGLNANGQRIAAFTDAIKKRPAIKLAPPNWLPSPPVGVMDLGTVSSEQLLAAIDQTPTARAFLILAGLPPFSNALAEKINSRSLKLVAVCGYSANVRRWLEAKAVAVAVIPRFSELPVGTPPPKTARDWFDREYQLVTPETLAQLPF